MGLLRVDVEVVHPGDPAKRIVLANALVDTGSEFSWIPAEALAKIGIVQVKWDETFRMANGHSIKRSIGYGILRTSGFETIDEIVFAQSGDLTLLGARTLDGFGATVDLRKQRLIPSGPHFAAAA